MTPPQIREIEEASGVGVELPQIGSDKKGPPHLAMSELEANVQIPSDPKWARLNLPKRTKHIPGDGVLAVFASQVFQLTRAHRGENRVVPVDDKIVPKVSGYANATGR
jgi:hypothetical protein